MAPVMSPVMRSIWHPVALLVLLLLGACGTGSTDFDFDTCGVRPRVSLPIALGGEVPVVTARIDGQTARLILDTGAEAITLTAPSVRRLGLGSDAHDIRGTIGVGGQSRDFAAKLHNMALDGVRIPDHSVAVLPKPLPHVGGVEPDGLLGVTILSQFEMELDFIHPRLTLYAGHLCPTTVVPLWPAPFATLDAHRSERGRFIVPIKVNGHDMAALIDTGTQVSVISDEAAARAGVTEADLAHDPTRSLSGAGPALVESHAHRFDRVEIGAESFPGVTLLVAPREAPDADVVLGMDYLKGHRLWLSYARQKVFITTSSGAPAS